MRSNQSRDREPPRIRDHEVIRCIGHGSYGEVWMARGVTGVLRAVKVIWREDYDLASIFERELEGIKRFEPISRRHAGLVDILQVGLHDDEGFYYYVMELADDVERGRDIDPETYVAHTFSAEMARREKIDLEACLRDGAVLAEALAHMHQHGLIHRDVKPSNVIYVDGEARLADIGLVAMSGQRSFVGTEGFVPPEGPGTSAADIYSLGMVLYEMGTGKDRLDFPDVPTSLGADRDRVLWTRLNKAICKACAAQSKDRYETADEMALALQGHNMPGPARLLPWAAAAAGIVALAGVLFASRAPVIEEGDPFEIAAIEANTELEITTDPPGAEVYQGENFLGVTPLLMERPTGSRLGFTMRLAGYRNEQLEILVGEERGEPLFYPLEPWIQPQLGERWHNSLAMEFAPRTDGHTAVFPTGAEEFLQFLDTTGRPFEGEFVSHVFEGEKDERFIVVVPYYDAEAFRSWLMEKDRAQGFLSAEHSYRLEPFLPEDEADQVSAGNFGDETEGEMAFRLVVEKQTYGRVFINSTPTGAVVLLKGEEYRTPVEFPRMKTGSIKFELRADGYEHVMVERELRPNEELELQIDMEATRAVAFGRDWKNSLGMEFVPLGDVLFGRWETRKRDYDYFAEQNGKKLKNTARWQQKPNQPAVEVSREEAEAFCKWLTAYEREREVIGVEHEYRLPTDLEWSRAVDLPPERGLDPASRDGRVRGMYPWRFGWPPPEKAGNFADKAAVQPLGKGKVIEGYNDGVRYTAQSTELPPNAKGIHNLSGNVWEWVEENYGGGGSQAGDGVVRGGSWQSYDPEELLSSHRRSLKVNSKLDSVGFRCVLAPVEGDSGLARD